MLNFNVNNKLSYVLYYNIRFFKVNADKAFNNVQKY